MARNCGEPLGGMRSAWRLSRLQRFRAPLPTLIAIGVLALLSGACDGDDGKPTITVAAASSLRHALPDIAAEFERAYPGVEVELRFAGSQVLASQIDEGAGDDLFISANPLQARRLMSAGLASRPTVVTANVLVVAVPNDGPWLSLRDLALADVRIAAGAPSVPVGALTEIALELVQLQDPETAAALRSKIATQDPNVRIVLSRLELGEADAAFVYASDVEATEGLRLIALPLRTPPNEYVAVLIEDADPAAENLLAWLLAPQAQAIFQLYGFLPSVAGVQAR